MRRFQHFGNLTLQVIVDGSASMNYGGGAGSVTKWEYASQLAAALSLLAIRQSEQVALAIAVDAVRASIPVGSAFSHLYRVIHLLEDFEPRGQEELRLALQQAQQMLPRRRVIFVLSDFLGEVAELTDAVQQLRFHGNDVICLQILTPSERDLEGLADGRFVDCENPQQAVVTEIDQVRQAYTQLMGEHVEAVEQNLRGCGAGHFLIKTDEHPLTVLRRVLAKR